MTTKKYRLDQEEQDILDSFERGEWVSQGEDLEKYQQAAKQTAHCPGTDNRYFHIVSLV